MENFRHCPICTEVPEQEVYQCCEGHIVCHLCISKVAGGRCPQCRTPFGEKKIRSRVLEVFLDGQEFECKFKDKGCAQLCKREEMTSHANACSFNPDTVPLCELLGAENCGFRVGIVSRAEVIAHFETVHGHRTNVLPVGTWSIVYSSEEITDLMITLKSRKRKVNQAINRWGLLAPSGTETSPLFFICSLLNRPVGFLSLFCFKVWNSGTNPSSNFKVKFELSKGSTFGSSSDPFPIASSMMVCSFKEMDRILEGAPPITVALSLLEESGFGADEEDCIRVKISEII